MQNARVFLCADSRAQERNGRQEAGEDDEQEADAVDMPFA